MSMDTHTIRAVVAVFNCLQLLGLTLLLVVLMPALFSARVRRMRTWHTMIISGIVYDLCYMLLMIPGQQFGPPPSFALCLFQSCLIYGAPVLLVSFCLAFLVEVRLSFRKSYHLVHALTSRWYKVFLALSYAIYGRSLALSARTQTLLLLAVPSFIYMVVFFTTLLIGLQQRESIELDQWRLYCHSTATSPTLITATIVLVETSIMIILEVFMAVILWKTRRRLGSTGTDDNLSSIFPPSLFFRFLAFAIYVICTIVISASILPYPTGNSPFWKMSLTTPPIGMALSFGIQKDIIAFYWHRQSDRVEGDRLI
ncbi:uncharacterized protein EV420DRAFT_1763092 [Desarmillaria tabescens]|uniref:Uncharacterized protein n=1 Tax=Armillaria tabescens TaxID=1929756 RepID=A0AA39N798_ARMTA|nr:uncharacterized protein EV420DRAFT_1763092 [Desarmillaria tabescens]KAK0460158.1 hypothetical protein EV420DRAFT_1763092 [Desarmillaria tabescens]